MLTNNCKILNKSFVVSLATLLVTLCLTVAISMRGKPSVVETNLENIPMEISGMHGVDDSFSESVNEMLNADINVYRHYSAKNISQMDLYIGYYGTAKGGRTRQHDPLICMPSQGWTLSESHEIKLKSKDYPDGVSVNYLLSTKDDLSLTTIYWYQSAGSKVLATGIKQNIQRFLGLVTHNKNDGAFVRITTLCGTEEAKAAMYRAMSFSEEIMDILPNYWPVER
jgi:EpsI family protein